MKKLLVIVDMVNGFIKEGAMADPYINTITPEVKRLIEEFIENKNGEIIAFCDSHTMQSEEFKDYPVHCLKGTKESELIEELQEYKENIIIFEKDTTNGFESEEYRKFIEEKQDEYDEIVVAGCCSDICVLNYVLSQKKDFDEKQSNVTITVPVNAIETFDGPGHKRSEANQYAVAKMLQNGIHIVDSYQLEENKERRLLF